MEFPQRLQFPDSVERFTHQRGLKPRIEYLKEDGNMEGKYLGQCLESIRWGSFTTVMYEIDPLQMADFIKNWMEQNKDDLKFHFREPDPDFKLPYINHEVCPRNSNHVMKAKALDGMIRCIEKDEIELKKNYADSFNYHDYENRMIRKHYFDNHPQDDEGFEKYLEDEDLIIKRPTCGAIISDKETTLSLLDIIDRLNVFDGRRVFCKPYCKDPEMIKSYGEEHRCFGHWPVKDHLVFPFDGWHLARNVEYCYNQEPVGTAPFTTPLVAEQMKRHLITPATTDLEKTFIEEIEKEIQKGISI